MHQEISPYVPHLRQSQLCRGLSPQELEMVAKLVRPVSIAAGQVLFRQSSPSDALYLVTSGLVKLVYEEADGAPVRVLDRLGRGDHFGDMGVLTGIPRTATAEAVVDSQLLAIDTEPFSELMVHAPGLVANLSRTLVWRLHHETMRRQRHRHLAVVGVVNASPTTRPFVPMFINAQSFFGESLGVLTDRLDEWNGGETAVFAHFPESVSDTELVSAVRAQASQMADHHGRLLIEFSATTNPHLQTSLATICEELFWLVDEREQEAGIATLRTWVATAPLAAARTHVVWLLRPSTRFAPRLPADLQGKLAKRSFKVPMSGATDAYGAGTSGPTHLQDGCRRGIGRLVRHLRGTRLGLALGGGGARGLAHLGVMRALDRAGIEFDVVAGTSCGALMGMAYAGAWPMDVAIREFRTALTPGRLWRLLPGGSGWYLLSRFRWRKWDGMLRKFLYDATMDQLQVPFCTVSVDLVSGTQVVRDAGDVVQAVLETINLPIVAPPILRDGQALLDGGVLNNVPGDILPDRGADFVVGVDVVNKLSASFAGNTPDTPTRAMRKPGLVKTVMRLVETQAYNLATIRSDALDLLITPATDSFDFFDFTRASELADAGEAAVEEALPRLRQLLADVEPI